MKHLQPHEKEILNSTQNINEKSVYLLLKYWHDKPLKYRRLYKKLNAIYNDRVNNDYIIAKFLDGLDWIGGDQLFNERGDPYYADENKTWKTNEIGKTHIRKKVYPLMFDDTFLSRNKSLFLSVIGAVCVYFLGLFTSEIKEVILLVWDKCIALFGE